MDDIVDRLRSALSDRYTIERELGAGGMATVHKFSELRIMDTSMYPLSDVDLRHAYRRRVGRLSVYLRSWAAEPALSCSLQDARPVRTDSCLAERALQRSTHDNAAC